MVACPAYHGDYLMNLIQRLAQRLNLVAFKEDECGAVTVDFVVLTAGIVALGLAVTPLVITGVTDGATAINADIAAATTP